MTILSGEQHLGLLPPVVYSHDHDGTLVADHVATRGDSARFLDIVGGYVKHGSTICDLAGDDLHSAIFLPALLLRHAANITSGKPRVAGWDRRFAMLPLSWPSRRSPSSGPEDWAP